MLIFSDKVIPNITSDNDKSCYQNGHPLWTDC